MIRVRLLSEGRTVKQITSRVGEAVILERIQKFEGPYDEIVVMEGELTEGAKEILQRVAKRVIPAAMAAGMALGGASGAQAQNHFPGTDRSIGQHISDIFSPNYREIVRQRKAEQDTERQAWNARQAEIRKAKIARAREEGRREAQGIGGTDMPGNIKVYDQARKSQDGKSYVLYDLQHNVIRIPVAGTEFVPADSQRLSHYLTARGGVYYVRQPAEEHQMEGITEDPVVGKIPATGGTSSSTIKTTGTRAPGGASTTPAGQDVDADQGDEQSLALDKDHGLDKQTLDAIKKAGVAVNIKEGEMSRLEQRLRHATKGGREVEEAAGDRYADQLAQKVYNERKDLDTSGEAAEFLDIAYDIAQKDLGRRRAHHMFAYDDDFVGDLIGAYAVMSQGKGVAEGVNVKQIKKDLDSGMSVDAVIGKHANRRTTNTDEIRRVIQQHAWEKRKNKTKEQDVAEGLSDIDIERQDWERMSPQEFQRAYGQSKEDWQANYDRMFNRLQSQTSKAMQRTSVKEGFTEPKMQAILDQYEDSWRAFKAGGEVDDNPEFYDALFNYFADSGEMPYEVARARIGDPIEWITNKMDALAGNEKVSEADEDDLEASAADQAAADKNIIMQLRKAADYEKPTQLSLDDGSRVSTDSGMAQKILRMFDQLRPDSKALLQQVLGTRKGFDELTKELGQARESVREAAEQYTSLNDAYPAGETEIWYWLADNARDYMMGYDFLKKQGIEVSADTIPTTHALIGKIRETDPEKIFSMMQGDSWSPEGQARDMIKKSGTGHTSMSVGDVIKIGNKWLMVDRFGFRDIASGANESVEVSETHLDPKRAAMLIADRIMGEVFDK